MRPSIDITWKALISRIEAARKTGKGNVSIACGGELYVRVIGVKRNVYWYRRDPQKGFIRLADFKNLSLAAARKLIGIKTGTVREPSEILFSEVAQKWLKTKEGLVRFINIKRHVDILKPLYNYKVVELTVPLVKEKLLLTDVSAYQLKYAISALCNIMDYAIEEDIIASHNFDLLRKSPSFAKHERGEGFKWVAISEFEGLFSRLLHLSMEHIYYYLMLALTCLRPGECRQLKIEYFDFEKKILSVPGQIMKIKSASAFRIPVTSQIEKLYRHILENNQEKIMRFGYLFPKKNSIGGADGAVAKNYFSTAWSYAVHDAHMHGFRKSSRTWMAEHEIPLEVAAKCLDHSVPTGADALYQKSDLLEKRRSVMEELDAEIVNHLPDELRKLFE